METRKPLYEIVAERLIRQIENGVAPWQRPWIPGKMPPPLPINPATGMRYRGAAALQLMSLGYQDPRWMTRRQAEALGGLVREGEVGTAVQFWDFAEQKAHGRGIVLPQALAGRERPGLFFASIFNGEQIDGLSPAPVQLPPEWEPIEQADRILRASGAVMRYGQSERSFYAIATDTIHMPEQRRFASADAFYAVALHELAHWTGHVSRLCRDQSGVFGTDEYAREELRAEIASMMLCEDLGLRYDPRHTAEYVANWTQQMRYVPMEIFQAAAEAEEIRNYLLGLAEKQQQVPPSQPLDLGAEAERTPQRVVFLHVPLDAQEEARELGATWHGGVMAWCVPEGVDHTPFKRWIPPAMQVHPDREYLVVPYGESKSARAAGAAWDPGARSWFVAPEADVRKLERWRFRPPAPTLPPPQEFAEALRAMGCVVSGEHPVMDGKRHRIPVQGQPPGSGEGAAFYMARMGGRAGGFIKNEQTGVEMRWRYKGYSLGPDEKQRLYSAARDGLQADAEARALAHAQAAEGVRLQLADLVPVAQPTPYMQSTGLAPQAGVFTDKAGKLTCIPAVDADGKPWSLQTIDEHGSKQFARNSRRHGCFHAVGGIDALARAPALVIGESYATAGSLAQSLGFATVAAFDAGNLPAVAKALQARFPDKPIVIAGDDDRHMELTQGINPGRAKAQDAAKSTGGTLLLPVFAAGENRYPSDLPLVTPGNYRRHQRTGSGLSLEQLAALEQMRQTTSFNDLAHRSALGTEGLDRQVRAAVQGAIAQGASRMAQRQAARAQPGVAMRAG